MYDKKYFQIPLKGSEGKCLKIPLWVLSEFALQQFFFTQLNLFKNIQAVDSQIKSWHSNTFFQNRLVTFSYPQAIVPVQADGRFLKRAIFLC